MKNVILAVLVALCIVPVQVSAKAGDLDGILYMTTDNTQQGGFRYWVNDMFQLEGRLAYQLNSTTSKNTVFYRATAWYDHFGVEYRNGATAAKDPNQHALAVLFRVENPYDERLSFGIVTHLVTLTPGNTHPEVLNEWSLYAAIRFF